MLFIYTMSSPAWLETHAKMMAQWRASQKPRTRTGKFKRIPKVYGYARGTATRTRVGTGGTISRTAKNARDVKRLQGKLTRLKKLDDATTGTLTYRSNSTARSISLINKQKSLGLTANSNALLELALAQTKYFNPAVPGTLTTGSSASGTYQRNVLIESVNSKLTVRNNYQVPCHMAVYMCHVKDDTNQDPVTAWGLGVPLGSNLTDEDDLGQYITDYNLVNDLYRVKCIHKGILQSGSQQTFSNTETDIEYDPSTVDNHGLSYQKEYKACLWLVVHKGLLCHDTIAGDVGLIDTGLDMELNNVVKVKYSAGINIDYTHVVNAYDTMTNAATIANKPLSGSQQFAK